MPPITFAHRGARIEEPENTLRAFRLALSLGASGLETDAWLSADGEAVLVHDNPVRRGFRRRHVGQHPADELASWEIPRLGDLYRELGTDFELSVDAEEPGVVGPIIDAARAAGAADRLWLCSGDLGLLTRLRPDAPDVHLVHSRRRRSLGPSLERHASDLAEAGIEVMNMHHTEWTKGIVSLFHRFDLRAFAWDAQEVRYLRSMIGMGVDAVYSDHVERMVATVAEFSPDA
ncbi:MAG: glycerophosphoryl diester phosphodiesterase [Actinomycetia bacterium]|nr:glycerophosphoryl diester phosphodiesterase [Actinomycetes bacterium]